MTLLFLSANLNTSFDIAESKRKKIAEKELKANSKNGYEMAGGSNGGRQYA